EHGAAAAGLHANQKTVRALALDHGGLKGAFGSHDLISQRSPRELCAGKEVVAAEAARFGPSKVRRDPHAEAGHRTAIVQAQIAACHARNRSVRFRASPLDPRKAAY